MPARVDPIRAREEPKAGGGRRLMAELSPRDARAWRDLAGRVAHSLEPRLGPRVLAGRAVLLGSGWRPAPLAPALRRARRAAAALARRGVLLRTDVRAFYPSVTPEALAAALLRAGADPGDARLAADLLEGWGSEGYAGLPVGPPASAVLANALLRGADAVLDGLAFLRWVDDYLIALPGEARAAPALDALDGALDALGLARSPPKTRLDRDPLWPGRPRRRRPYG